MFDRIRRIWKPENFHYHHALQRGNAFFEGWYFKVVDAAGTRPYALISVVFLGADAHAFIQVLDGREGSSDYHRFPLSAFQASHSHFDVSIGQSRFTRSGISLNIAPDETSVRKSVTGNIEFDRLRGWPVTLTSPGVMGPYSFVPFMECNHGILSMDHALSGELRVDGIQTSMQGGRGYIEKDWGRGFPRGYTWAQSNHFVEPGISISASVAHIPWLTGAFCGYLVGFQLHDKLYRFTTYTGAKIERLEVDNQCYRLLIHDRIHRLELTATRTGGAILHAPYEKQMIERVAEAMDSTIDLRLERLSDNELLFEGEGKHGCLEVQGDLDAILSRT
jgi:hypothetical protein